MERLVRTRWLTALRARASALGSLFCVWRHWPEPYSLAQIYCCHWDLGRSADVCGETAGHVQCDEQGGGAVADVVVGDAQRIAQTHGQQWLGTDQGLDLRFLVNAEHDCLVWRVEVEPADVAHLRDKERIR